MPAKMGVGDGSTQSIYGNETSWPNNEPVKIENAVGGEEELRLGRDNESLPPAVVSRETQPFQIEFGKDKCLSFFQTGAWTSIGVFIAENLVSGKAWIIPAAKSDRNLMLVNKSDWDQGVEAYQLEIENLKEGISGAIWPSEHQDLVDDPSIGPMISILGGSLPQMSTTSAALDKEGAENT